jgi:uncharacterized membrane protein (GlpM family)
MKTLSRIAQLGVVGATVLAPGLAFAQQQIVDANSLMDKLTAFGASAIPFLISFAVLYLVYAIVKYLVTADDADKKKEAAANIAWGIFGLFLILSIWGLVSFLRRTLNFGGNANPPTQDFPRIIQPPHF